jgi:hypothetical protein
VCVAGVENGKDALISAKTFDPRYRMIRVFPEEIFAVAELDQDEVARTREELEAVKRRLTEETASGQTSVLRQLEKQKKKLHQKLRRNLQCQRASLRLPAAGNSFLALTCYHSCRPC